MSKKTATSPPPSAAAGDMVSAKALVPERVDLADAMKRLNAFVFTVDTDTKDTVEVKPLVTAACRDPTIAPALVTVDRVDAANFVVGLSDPSLNSLITEVKAQMQAITDGAGDASIVAQCIRARIVALAVEREEARLDEIDAAAARHAELVERLMEEGLTRSEAEKAAEEEEAGEAAGGAEDDEEEEAAVRQQCFVQLRGFPSTTAEIAALSDNGVPLDALLCLNSQARLGRREEQASTDPKAKGKKPEAKKPDQKRKGKGAAEEVVVVQESLAQLLAKERAKVSPFDSEHPLRHTVMWPYTVPCAESKTGAVDEVTGAKLYDLLESEGEVTEKLTNEIIRLEQAAIDYRAWNDTKSAVKVAAIETDVEKVNDDDADDAAAAAAAAAAEAAKAEAAKAELAAKEKAAASGGKKGAAAKGKGPAVAEESAQPEITAAPAAPPPLPRSATELTIEDELYRRLYEEVASANLTPEVRVHCMLEQVQDSVSARHAKAAAAEDGQAAPATSSAATIAETIASKTRRDVADFCDYILAQLDGTQDSVFEAARKRRLKAAEATGGADGDDDDATEMAKRAPLADAEYLRLLPATRSQLDPDALLLGVPLRKIEGRVCRALHAGALSDENMTVANTDLPTLETMEDAGKLFKHLLVDRIGLTDGDASTVLKMRTQAQVLSHDSLKDRIVEAIRSEPGGTLYKAACKDGSFVLVLAQAVPSERRRFASLWRAFHGNIPFPLWLEWADFARAENLFFNPPPRDDDDFDEDDVNEGEDEEEEEEEEEEVGVDEDGEPIMRKKPRKVVIYPPEYTNTDLIVTDELRRRANLGHLQTRLAVEQEQLLLANNHTASLMHVETSTLYPSDGTVVASHVTNANDRSVHCTAYTDTGVSFGFRATVTPAQEEPAAAATDAQAAADAAAQAPKSPKHTPRGAKDSKSAEPAAPAGEESTPKPEPPRPTKLSSGVSVVASLGDDATVFVTTECNQPRFGDSPADAPVARSGNATPPAVANPAQPTTDDDTGAAAAGDIEAGPAREPVEPVVPRTTLRCVFASGVTVEAFANGSVRLVHDAPRESPVTVYNPLTRQITRISCLEQSRTVLLDGTVLCQFADGTRMNMFANGNTAVLYEGHWLITNAAGRRVLKDASGRITPLIQSLITSNTDTETLSKLTTREDGVVTVQYDDGKALAQHIDGTRMWRDPERTIVEVEADGLPRIFAIPGAGAGDDVPLPQRSKLAVKALGDLTLTVVPNECITVQHPATGFTGAVDLKTHLVHCDPGMGVGTRYVLDAAFGGLRVVDGQRSHHVTPFGRTVVQPIERDHPVAPTQEPGVKQVIDVFMRSEAVSPAFAEAMAVGGQPLESALHMAADVPEFLSHGATSTGISQPPRSRQLRAKEQQCVALLQHATPPSPPESSSAEAPVTMRSPLMFVVSQNGCLELVRRTDVASFLKNAIHNSNLLFTDVHREPVSVLKDQEAELTADGVVVAPPKLGTEPQASYGGLRESVIVSVAPSKPVVRSGVPKILLDLRRASAKSGPMSVAAFLHELKQGPQLQTRSGTSDIGLTGAAVTVATRHFVTVDPAVLTGASKDKTPLITATAGDPCYERALFHLARAIPSVIAAQLSFKPQQRLSSTTRGRRTNTGGSRGGSHAATRRGEDPEFAKQMEEIAEKELATRKPWPTPVADRKKLIERTKAAALGNFWETDLGATHVDDLKRNNEQYTAASGYRKVPVPQYNSTNDVVVAAAATAAKHSSTKPAAEKPTVPSPPRQPRTGAASSKGASTMRTTQHVSPAGMNATTSLPAAPTATKIPRAPPSLAATPHSIHMGTLVAGHRYAVDVVLNNIGTAAARYRLAIEPQDAAQFIHTSVPQLALAPGMSTHLTLEVDGRQPEGELHAHVTAMAVGGAIQVPLHCMTVPDSDRGSAGHPRPGVRILGESQTRAAFVPGTTKRAKTRAPPVADVSDSDDEAR